MGGNGGLREWVERVGVIGSIDKCLLCLCLSRKLISDKCVLFLPSHAHTHTHTHTHSVSINK